MTAVMVCSSTAVCYAKRVTADTIALLYDGHMYLLIQLNSIDTRMAKSGTCWAQRRDHVIMTITLASRHRAAPTDALKLIVNQPGTAEPTFHGRQSWLRRIY
jgi:hypothetical protein